jgi:hypothetical protein
MLDLCVILSAGLEQSEAEVTAPAEAEGALKWFCKGQAQTEHSRRWSRHRTILACSDEMTKPPRLEACVPPLGRQRDHGSGD